MLFHEFIHKNGHWEKVILVAAGLLTFSIIQELNTLVASGFHLLICFKVKIYINSFLQIEQVRGVRPMPLPEMANLFNSLRLMVCPGLVSSYFFSYGPLSST